jgi:hypothetical protein
MPVESQLFGIFHLVIGERLRCIFGLEMGFIHPHGGQSPLF